MEKQVDFEIIWEGQPNGLWDRFKNIFHCNFTHYQISKDELIITTGLFVKKQESCELYTLKDPDLTQNLIQQWLNTGTISLHVDSKSNSSMKAGNTVYLKNVSSPKAVRKLLRDAIEEDVKERNVTVFDSI